MEKTCPKCSKTFICRVDNITLCGCRKIKLKTGVREYIKYHWGKCLCLDCLKYVNESIME